MKKLLFMVLGTFVLMATELPQSIKTTVKSINSKKEVTLATSIPKGRSGIVIHSYGNGLFAITHTAISLGGNRASIGKYNMLKHENLPTIKTPIKAGDQVIFGNLYNNVLLIAPDEQSYSNITKSIKRVWIHPDMFATYLISNDEDEITLKNLKRFAIDTQVGLVAILAKNELRILDPISGKYIAKISQSYISPKPQSPFYARVEQVSVNIFSEDDKKEFLPYYKGIERIK
jgi:hypothetical protein